MNTAIGNKQKTIFILHLVLVVLETISLVYLLAIEGPAVFRYYTVLSNVLMLAASAWYLGCFFRKKEIPKYGVAVPALLTILYGIIALILNIAKLLVGPYFFLEVYSTPAGTIAMWFVIIGILCVILTVAYMFMHRKVRKR